MVALTVNCSKSCMCLKQSGPHGTPSDNIISFPVNCGFPEGITLLTWNLPFQQDLSNVNYPKMMVNIPWVSQTECRQFMLGQKVLRLDVNLCLRLSASGKWLGSCLSWVASNLEAPGQWTTSLMIESWVNPGKLLNKRNNQPLGLLPLQPCIVWDTDIIEHSHVVNIICVNSVHGV